MTNDNIEKRLRSFFASAPSDILTVYLYGSVARGEARDASDVDVAILFRDNPPHTLEHPSIRLAADLERRLGLPADVVVLNDAPPDLIHRVLRDGSLLVDRDPGARIRFEIKSRNEFFDLQPILRRYRRASRDDS
jgi:predicted nucleotidyltransferase